MVPLDEEDDEVMMSGGLGPGPMSISSAGEEEEGVEYE